MKIFLTVSKTGLSKHLKDYQKVFNELNRHSIKLIATFKTYPEKLKKIRNRVKSKEKVKYAKDFAIRKDVFKSDAIIIEASYPSFHLGFEAFYALSLQKPVLVLSKFHNYGNLINQPNFFGAKYTDFTLPDEINKFLKHVKHYNLRNRFNLFIADNHKQHLEKSAKHFGVSMSDYVRKLIDKDIIQ